MVHWDLLLDDKNSGKADIFWGRMRRAVCVVEPVEHQRVKFMLSRKPKYTKLK